MTNLVDRDALPIAPPPRQPRRRRVRLSRRIVGLILDIDPEEHRQRIRWRRVLTKTALVGIVLALPALVSNIIFDWIPTIDGVVRSFFTWSDRNPEPVFVGLGNFQRVLVDPEFHASLGNMLFFLVAYLVLMVPTIVCSVVLFRIQNSKLQYVYRVLLCLPMVVPALVFTLTWIFILGYDFGAINNVLVDLGFERVRFLGDPELIKWTILLTGIPFVSANSALIYLGGLNSISDSVWDAAKLDGVGPIRKFFSLEFPLIIGQFKLNLMGVIGAGITVFATQLVFYNASVHHGLITPGLLMYFKAFPNTGAPDYGYAYALGLILFLLALTVSLLALKFLKSRD
ncbi:carbohydrate ABC transporter permease [Tenggerimyces flavus]|uniref:Carbohydrate ABC transporter permease n=1 Tax=Tenggerimyces flavus TaxID=1708749 RepID=A0ABV7YQ12_9ACTN|nr:sugar ABC transporter permease [Tenggerimyces flavus]MBM7786191.1 raffinose/stachyose/melibiose transport system permease protein [Tenggerimyces flavus]